MPAGTNARGDRRRNHSKIAWRLIPYIFVPYILVLYILAYLDRVNVGFAALRAEPWPLNPVN